MRKKKIDVDDIVGMRFGKLEVLRYVRREGNARIYECQCDCGKKKEIQRAHLLSGNTGSCGDCTHIEQEGTYYRYYCENGDSWIFDAVDLEFVKEHRWYISFDGYPHTKVDGKGVIFHRLLFNLTDDDVCDHINGDTRDNRRANLRVVSQSDNMKNQSIKSNNTSGYKGVSFNKLTGKFEAYIYDKPYHRLRLGLFPTAVEAACAYDDAARLYHGSFACVNFPKEGEQGCHRKHGRSTVSTTVSPTVSPTE